MRDKKKKVMIVHNYYQLPGGEDTVVANEKKLLEDHGHEVILYTRSNAELKTMPWMRKAMLPFITIFNIRTYRDIRRLIRENKIEIVHVHNTLTLISPAVYYAALSCRVPVVQTVHNFRLLCPGAMFYRDGHICEDCVEKGLRCAVKHGCYRGSRAQTLLCAVSTMIHRMTGVYGKLNYICLTEFNKGKLLQLNRPGKKQLIDPEKVFIKPNFTYAGKIERQVEDYYLYMGRIEKIKGVTLLLEAFADMPDKKLILAGTGPELDELRERYAHCFNITFAGFQQREELNRLLTGARAVIAASQLYETFGLVVAEAFACHVPVIVGDIGNMASLVDDGIDGVKFQHDSAEALKQAVRRFEKMDGREMGEAAHEKYLKRFSEKKNYSDIKSVYRNVNWGGVNVFEPQLFEEHTHRKDQFVFVGRLEEIKGIDMLLRVWQRLGNHFSKLIVCGTGPLDEWCGEFLKKHEIQNVELRGYISNGEVKRIIRESRALIMPTRLYEGFPMSIVEAYSVGTPVIGPNVGNAGGLIRHGITGLTFEYNNDFSLQETVGKFVRAECGEVMKYYKEHFAEAGNYKKLIGIYGKVYSD